jgi:hypothetical protein
MPRAGPADREVLVHRRVAGVVRARGLGVGFGRIVVSEIEAPNLFADLV